MTETDELRPSVRIVIDTPDELSIEWMDVYSGSRAQPSTLIVVLPLFGFCAGMVWMAWQTHGAFAKIMFAFFGIGVGMLGVLLGWMGFSPSPPSLQRKKWRFARGDGASLGAIERMELSNVEGAHVTWTEAEARGYVAVTCVHHATVYSPYLTDRATLDAVVTKILAIVRE
jgi:hypothetical protein